MNYLARHRARTVAACHADAVANLHERLGHMVAVGGKVRAGGHTYDARSESPLRGLQLYAHVDHAAGDRLTDFAAEARAEMGEARWAELNKEWEQ